MRHVVIVGGGFAGLWSAMGVARQIEEAGAHGPGINVTLVSRDPWLVIRPRLHEAHPSEHMRVPLRAVLDPIGATLVEATVREIDPDARTVTAKRADGQHRVLRYDGLVLAAGSQLHRPPVPGLDTYALSVDTFEDALALERSLQRLPSSPPGPERYTAIVVGAGFTGVEVAAEMVGRLAEIAGGSERPRVILVEREDVVGPDLGARPRPVIEEALNALGVERRLGVTVQQVDSGGVTLSSGEHLPARTVVWTAGLRASPLTALLPATVDALGRLPVDQTLRVPGVPGVLAAGDVAAAPADAEHTTLLSCQHALTLGVFAGHNAIRELSDLPLLPYAPLPYQTCLDLGAWGALLTRGWDRAPIATGAEAKAIKRRINTQWIYPPTSGDRAGVIGRQSLAPTAPGGEGGDVPGEAVDLRLAAFERHRGTLRALAYRMLGSLADAEDVVQETFLRWRAVDATTVESARAWLVTTCSRLAIDELRSARRGRETYVGPWLPEPLVDQAAPAELAELNESLTTAFLLLLERLGPLERAAFVLHEVLEFSHAEVASILGRSEVSSRQLVSRARRRLSGEARRSATPALDREAHAAAFFTAMRAGDVPGLVALLAPGAECRSDGGGKVVAATRVVRGALRVARLLAGVTRKQPADVRWSAASVNYRPGCVLTRGGRAVATVSLEWDQHGRIAQVFTVRNPDKLRFAASSAS